MKFILADYNKELIEAWKEEFKEYDNFEFYCGDVFDKNADLLGSPANSFGFMNGGIELAYSNKMGWHIQEEFQRRIKEEFDGEILVGQACVIETGFQQFPNIILAPTMRVPMYLDGTPNVYLSAKAIFLAAKRFEMNNSGSLTCLIPGLGTGTGYVPFKTCAQKMRMAYEDFYLGQAIFPQRLMMANIKHMEEIS
jgi:O-acetyl-ADP-ribose deacetylase (regulator of RNase III)